MNDLSRLLVIFGAILMAVGFLMPVVSKIPGIGKLPGDILIRRENFTFYFPLATSLIMSIALTFILNLLGKK